MSLKILKASVVALVMGTNVFANTSKYKSSYAGEETRIIKSLSAKDIEDLTTGKGWGLAKAAELNGIPGPAHILEMKDKINLTSSQERQIKLLYENMKKDVILLGATLVNLERNLNQQFANGTITDETLKNMLAEIGKTRQELRYVHLSTHLKTPNILSRHQVTLYNKLRGYTSDPCKAAPQGHDPKMWKAHNQCS